MQRAVTIGLALSSMITSFVVAMSDTLLAAEPAWPAAAYTYVVVDQDLRTVLEQFGTNTGLRVVLSAAVQGRVHGRMPSLPPREFLNRLTQEFGLDWYYDGAVISISAASEAQTQLLTVEGAGYKKLYSALSGAGLLDLRYGLRPGPGTNIVVVSGPPRYLAMVQQAATAVAADKEPKHDPAAGDTLVVFRGTSTSRVQFP
ncbi:nodulation protein NolW [Lichenihabitans sp. PAMC28606]|uniref:nodulation protein NolW n=1 Tax=Lichenihabitans sp. PAMC28606 TaxID=2880932 RepID=UPI001D0B22CA|nr:nodulation protein NolW [Lichenihabitans sp. PAMC28606]UDL94594.1 nodulation protein NolW [Lichenihabitans sp. PAMC28606]